MALNEHDRRHLQRLAAIARMVERLYDAAAEDAAAIGAMAVRLGADGEKPFDFEDYPQAKERMDALLSWLREQMEVVVAEGVAGEWLLSEEKNDDLVRRVLGLPEDAKPGDMPEALRRRWMDRNEKGCEAFLKRKERGLGLSERLWKATETVRSELAMGIDVGIREGKPAAAMARDLQQYLKHPDKLFRRVRDERGVLQLSKNAAAYHPGTGTYRSSYRNARRLAVTEVNTAYHTADHERWQQLDFVVGIEVHLSGNHTCKGRDGKPHRFTDICDQLAGKYPKDFKFTGWHPHCRCYATSVLKTDEEMEADTQRILDGEPVTGDSVNAVKDVPEGFKDWAKTNSSRIKYANTLPYFVADNTDYVATIVNEAYPSTKFAELAAHQQFDLYAAKYGRKDKIITDLMFQYQYAATDMGKTLIVKQIKERAASLSKQELAKWGVVDYEMDFVGTEYNKLIQPKQTLKTTNGKLVNVDEKRLDLLVYRDKYGKEFAYPIGIMKSNAFSAVTASEAINGFPPYIKQGIERVSFFDIPCPTNEYWAIEYNIPGFTAAATDGGNTTFYMNPKNKEEFSKLMAHEAGHILDGEKHRYSSSKEWQEAVVADDEHNKNVEKGRRVSDYAKTNDSEDFAECMKEYIHNHGDFKKNYPNRAAYIRKMAQQLSGYKPKFP
ncbi:MAG: hypothetical protein J5529_03090 [Prevotella sp.]|nr:hypothetical protein [Prevotella sp.]